MSRNYDNWEKLVGAVLRREKDRQLALFQSFSSFSSVDGSSRPSFASDMPAGADPAAPSSQNVFVSRKITAIRLEEIKLATQNFQQDTLLGEGRFGPIFKGWIHEHLLTAVKPGSGLAVAIRKLNKGEILCLNLPPHPNLVKLIGYNFEEGNRLLVYEFVPNGSLDNHLFTRGHQLLSWEKRVKVAIGAARGLSFYHDMSITISHQDVKTSSILLDDEFNAKLSDFDLSTTHISVKHLNDYAAPETKTGRLTMKSDVYSFGVILLELFSGLCVCDKNRPIKEQNLVVWAKTYMRNKKKMLQILDNMFEGQYPHDGAYKIWKLAFQCLSLNPELRPAMTKVVDTLEQLLSPLSAGPHYRYNLAELTTGIDTEMAQSGLINSSILLQDLVLTFDRSCGSFPLGNAVPMSFNEIKKATANFRPDLLLEKGTSVFKGVIHDFPSTAKKPESVILVAVKRINKEQLRSREECLAAINNWRELCHPNLVKLIGYCFEADNRILVYEYMPRGSLSNHLLKRGVYLTWEIRLQVALCVARALAYLHGSGLTRALDSGDILLDGVYNAKLSYSCLPRDVSTTFVKFAEPPEYLSTGRLTAKSDVYCFGVVFLELLTGRQFYEKTHAIGRRNRVNWARPFLGRKIVRIMDRALKDQYSYDEASKVAKLASKCLSIYPESRPSMTDVVVALKRLQSP